MDKKLEWRGGEGGGCQKLGRGEGGRSKLSCSVVGWSPGSSLGLALLLLSFSAAPRAPGRGGRGWRQGPGKQTLGPLAPLHIPPRSPTHLASRVPPGP